MFASVIDSHIHIDQYCRSDRELIIHDAKKYNINALIAVATDVKSAHNILKIASKYEIVKPAIGFHPEQSLPDQFEIDHLIKLIRDNKNLIYAIGEVGLPYYLKHDRLITSNEKYITLLTTFIKLACELNKPLALHAIYEDAAIVCRLLEKYQINKAHFHWFKGDQKTINKMIYNEYYISITPDVLYEKEIENIVKSYPLHLMMVETDGPWPFFGPFNNEMTHPKMIHEVIKKIGEIKRLSYVEVAQNVYENTVNFYEL